MRTQTHTWTEKERRETGAGAETWPSSGGWRLCPCRVQPQHGAPFPRCCQNVSAVLNSLSLCRCAVPTSRAVLAVRRIHSVFTPLSSSWRLWITAAAPPPHAKPRPPHGFNQWKRVFVLTRCPLPLSLFFTHSHTNTHMHTLSFSHTKSKHTLSPSHTHTTHTHTH